MSLVFVVLNKQQQSQHTNLRVKFIYFIPCHFYLKGEVRWVSKNKITQTTFLLNISFFPPFPSLGGVRNTEQINRHVTWLSHVVIVFMQMQTTAPFAQRRRMQNPQTKEREEKQTASCRQLCISRFQLQCIFIFKFHLFEFGGGTSGTNGERIRRLMYMNIYVYMYVYSGAYIHIHVHTPPHTSTWNLHVLPLVCGFIHLSCLYTR